MRSELFSGSGQNESDISGYDINHGCADSVGRIDGLHNVKVRVLENALDELFRSLAIPVMAFAIVVLRGWYNGRRRWPARLIEGAIFGLVSVWVHPVAQYVFATKLGFPEAVARDAAIAFVCALGYIGADTLSDAARNYFGGKR